MPDRHRITYDQLEAGDIIKQKSTNTTWFYIIKEKTTNTGRYLLHYYCSTNEDTAMAYYYEMVEKINSSSHYRYTLGQEEWDMWVIYEPFEFTLIKTNRIFTPDWVL